MDYPTNKKEWWQYLEMHWDDILSFVAKTGIDLSSYTWYDGKVLPHTIITELNILKENRDPTMYYVMERVWGHAPDAKWIHTYPGFNYICNLCSEGPICLEKDLFGDRLDEE